MIIDEVDNKKPNGISKLHKHHEDSQSFVDQCWQPQYPMNIHYKFMKKLCMIQTNHIHPAMNLQPNQRLCKWFRMLKQIKILLKVLPTYM